MRWSSEAESHWFSCGSYYGTSCSLIVPLPVYNVVVLRITTKQCMWNTFSTLKEEASAFSVVGLCLHFSHQYGTPSSFYFCVCECSLAHTLFPVLHFFLWQYLIIVLSVTCAFSVPHILISFFHTPMLRFSVFSTYVHTFCSTCNVVMRHLEHLTLSWCFNPRPPILLFYF